MADTKHTPGPWIIEEPYLSEVQTADMLTIASCWHEHADGMDIKVTGVLPCSVKESAANARLIAAAPELLEALKAMLPEANRLDEHLRPSFETCEAARAAIAKAEPK